MIFYWFFLLRSTLYCTPTWVTAYKVWRFGRSPPPRATGGETNGGEIGVSKFLCVVCKMGFTCFQIRFLYTHIQKELRTHTHTHTRAALIPEMSAGPLALLDLLNLKQMGTWNPGGDLFRGSAVSCHVAARVHFLGHWQADSITQLRVVSLAQKQTVAAGSRSFVLIMELKALCKISVTHRKKPGCCLVNKKQGHTVIVASD